MRTHARYRQRETEREGGAERYREGLCDNNYPAASRSASYSIKAKTPTQWPSGENKVAKEAVKLLRIMDVFISRNDFLTTGLGLQLGLGFGFWFLDLVLGIDLAERYGVLGLLLLLELGHCYAIIVFVGDLLTWL